MRQFYLFFSVLFFVGCGSSAVAPPVSGTHISTAHQLEEVGPDILPNMKWQQGGPDLPPTAGRFVDAWWDGTTYWLVDQRAAIIWQQDPSDTSSNGWTKRADLSGLTGPGSEEQGLLSAAVGSDGRIYAWCTEKNTGTGFLVRMQGLATWETLHQVDQPASNHNGGCLRFGPGGYLYLAIGDGGGANDEFGLTRNRDSWCGKIVRLDVSPKLGWRIPNDNPTIDGRRDEIFAVGFRNPWRMSYDSKLNGWWVADVGQNNQEEVSFVVAGSDGGWPYFEGTRRWNQNIEPITPPVLSYGSIFGRSIIGGIRLTYGGPLDGAYVWSDFVSGRIGAILPGSGSSSWQWRWVGQQDIQPVHLFKTSTNGLAMLTWQGQWYELTLSPAGEEKRFETVPAPTAVAGLPSQMDAHSTPQIDNGVGG